MVKKKDFVMVVNELGYVKSYWRILGIIGSLFILIELLAVLVLFSHYNGIDITNAVYFDFEDLILIVDVVTPEDLDIVR